MRLVGSSSSPGRTMKLLDFLSPTSPGFIEAIGLHAILSDRQPTLEAAAYVFPLMAES